jgi:antitoxin component of RelBE/YafQ-DinJ toxin-antitoxin module
MKIKYPTSVRLTEEAKILLRALADRLGISMGDMLEILIRDAARHADLLYDSRANGH